MAYYSDDWIDEVRLRSDLVSVVSEYVQLKPNGRRHIGLCPFHSEKTPSFSVDADKQLYYCFGCHAGGNVFRFVMEMEHMEFPEAVRHLAERAHIPIPEGAQERSGPSREVKERLGAALTQAARWYYKRLYEPQGQSALAYLHGRGLGDNTIRRFGLGATGEGWDHLTTHLQGQGFTRKELEDANLTLTRGDKPFDMFRSRAMFPIFDMRGKVVAFGGRILGEGQPKYLNSSDTPLFNKRRTVYGLNFIKGTVGRVYLVEGYMDVVSLSQHGVQGCLATLGTALTPEQAKLIRRKAGEDGEVVIVYDGDAAGQRAIRRALDIFAMEGAKCRVAVIPSGQDPDDYVRANGREAFYALPLLTATDYLLDGEKTRQDMGSLEGRTAYATAAAKIIRAIDSPVEVENYVKRLMVETGFPRDVLYEQIGRTPKTRLSARVSGNTANQYRDTIREKEPSDDVKAQQQLLNLLCAYGNEEEYGISQQDFTDPLCRELAGVILPARDPSQAISRLLNDMEDRVKAARVAGIFTQDIIYEPDQVHSMIRGFLKTIRHRVMESRLEELAQLMDSAAKEHRLDDLSAYQGEFAKISQLLSAR